MKFAKVPESLLDSQASDRAIRLYAVLDRFAGARRVCWPSRRVLADRCRCSEPSVDRALDELRALGYVTVERRGKRRSNVYRLPARESPHTVDNPVHDTRDAPHARHG